MKPVWPELVTLASTCKAFSPLEVARLAASAPSHWTQVNKKRRSDVEGAMDRIASTAAKLAGLLKDHRDAFVWADEEIDTVSMLRKAARDGNDPLRRELYNYEVEQYLSKIDPAIDAAGLARYFPPLHDVLDALAKSAKISVDWLELMLRPTRAAAESAGRTYTIRVISHYFRQHGGGPRHTLVSAIVSTALDDLDVTDDLVRHNTEDL